MIERKFVAQKIREFEIQEYLEHSLEKVGLSHTRMVKTPLGEKIVIYTSRPGLIVGKKGQNIKLLTKNLKKRFQLENPQIEISEIENPSLDAKIVAERIVDSLERFGSEKFKAIGHKVMSDVMASGALGIEIIVSGKVPSDRAKSWRFYTGYLKKCGEIAIEGVRKANLQAKLKTGIIGIKVSIMPPDLKLPDDINIIDAKEEKKEPVTETAAGETPIEPAPEAVPEDSKKKKGSARSPAKQRKKDENKGTKVNE
ncbi:30S ribosomal protein S3 [Candidatus Woesearchaeota archaeon]|nr:30S ribosomal protein S3 [Candidatus Woesearchaeota archaeon]MBI2130921.1 30S ribosomal protein S3 [Candidatus Woesearchaeota archaeon]MBI2660971.1 30S ribosomal protein S3 [Candidatus Woesearchaeota archaeon]